MDGLEELERPGPHSSGSREWRSGCNALPRLALGVFRGQTLSHHHGGTRQDRSCEFVGETFSRDL
jgi:hypothetical protein